MCAIGIAISSPAPPTSFMGPTSEFSMAGTTCSIRSIFRNCSRHPTRHRNEQRLAPRIMKESLQQPLPSIDVAKKLAEHGIFLSHGDFYAMTVVERVGKTPHGLVRAGCACYTTSQEVDRLLAGVGAL